MKTFILSLFAIAASIGAAEAMTDYGCVNRCTQQGNQYGLCMARCSY